MVSKFLKRYIFIKCTLFAGVPEPNVNSEVGKLLKSKLEFGMRLEAYIETQNIEGEESSHTICIPKLLKILKKHNMFVGK